MNIIRTLSSVLKKGNFDTERNISMSSRKKNMSKTDSSEIYFKVYYFIIRFVGFILFRFRTLEVKYHRNIKSLKPTQKSSTVQ